MKIRHLTATTAAMALVGLPLAPIGISTSADAAAATPTCNGKSATIVLGADAPPHPVGTDGDDVVVVQKDANIATFEAGRGDDTICYLSQVSTTAELMGGPGNDRISAAGFTYPRRNYPHLVLDGGTGNDTLIGSLADDAMIGGTGNDVLFGMGNGDFLEPGLGNDIVRGGDGQDVWAADTSGPGVTVDASTGTVSGQGHDRVYGVKTYIGTDKSDVMRGGSENDYFEGGNGFDTLIGNGGRDYAQGGHGIDRCVAEATQGCEK